MLVSYLLGLLVCVMVGLPAAITALRHRGVLLATTRGHPPSATDTATDTATASETVTVTAVACVVVLALLGAGFSYLANGMAHMDTAVPSDSILRALVSSTAPAAVVVVALVAARATRRHRITFWLALVGPALPLTLFFAGYAVLPHSWFS